MRVPTVINPQSRPSQRQQGYAQGTDISGAWDALGNSFKQLSAEINAKQEEREKFDVSKAVLDESVALSQDFDQRKKASPLGAKDFTKDTLEAYDARHRSLLDEWRQAGHSERSVDSLALQLQNMRAGLLSPALQFQAGSYKVKVAKDFDGMVTTGSQGVLANPYSLDSTLGQLRAAADQTPDFSAPEKEEFYSRGESVLMQSAADGMGTYYPDKVIELLAPEEPAVATPTPSPAVGGGVVEGAGWKVIDRPGSNRDGGARKHKGWDISPTTGNHGWYPDQDFTISSSHDSGGITGNFAVVTLADGTRLELSHLESLPKNGSYKAGQLAAIAGNTGSAKNTPTHFHVQSPQGDPTAYFTKAGTKAAPAPAPAEPAKVSEIVPLIPGNIDITRRPVATNEDGTISTVRTISIGTEQGEVLIPTVSPEGKILSDEEAIKLYNETGKHLGIFTDVEDANQYAEDLHKQQEQFYSKSTAGVSGKGVREGPTGDPVLDKLDANLRLRALRIAQGAQAQKRAEDNATFDIMLENASTAFLTTGSYGGVMPTQEQFIKRYGSAEGLQRWEAFKNTQQVGQFITGMKTQSEAEIQRGVEALRPTDTASPTYATDLNAYMKAQDAAGRVMQARLADPAAYVVQNFPQIGATFASAQSGDDYARAFRMMQQAQAQLGIPEHLRKPMTDEMLERDKFAMKSMGADQKNAFLAARGKQLGGAYDQYLELLSKDKTFNTEIYASSMTETVPGYGTVGGDIFRGQSIYDADPSRRPKQNEVETSFQKFMGSAIGSMNGQLSKAVSDAARALYIQRNGPADELDVQLYEGAVRDALGGKASDPDTGIVDLRPDGTLWGKLGAVTEKTILPPGVTGTQFEAWKDQIDQQELIKRSKSGYPPRFASGQAASGKDVVEYGVFVQVAPGEYVIKMATDGLPLVQKNGKPYVMKVDRAWVLGSQSRPARAAPRRSVVTAQGGR